MAKSTNKITFTKLQKIPIDRKSTRLNSSHITRSRMPSSAFTKLQKIPMARNLSYKIITKGIKQISIFKLKLCPKYELSHFLS